MATDIKNDGDLSTSLVSCWLTDSSGLTADLHGTNTLTNDGVVLDTGKQGDGGDFEVGDSDRLSITDGDQTGLEPSTTLSMAMWVKFETVISVSLMGKGDGATADQYRWYHTGTNIGLGVNTATYKQVAWTPSTATWYHIAVTYDSGANEEKFYVNGSQQGSTQTAGGSITGTSLPFNIGANADQEGFFDGIINQALFYSKVLTGTEITALYNSGSGIPYEAVAGGNSNFLMFM